MSLSDQKESRAKKESARLTHVEYALIIAGFAVAITAVVFVLGPRFSHTGVASPVAEQPAPETSPETSSDTEAAE
jgi:hypothetical protein